jgi:hypothetical protein
MNQVGATGKRERKRKWEQTREPNPSRKKKKTTTKLSSEAENGVKLGLIIFLHT